MSYLKEGSAKLVIEGNEYCATPGDLTFIPANTTHDHIKTSKEDAVFLWWHFNFTTSYGVDILKLVHLPTITTIENTLEFENTFIRYLESINNADTIPEFITRKARALDVLASLFESVLSLGDIKLNSEVPEVFLKILEDVSYNAKANLSLRDIAEKYHMNPTYISNRFKKYFGKSPIALHRELLIERAKELLLSSMTIFEIAEDLGFSDVSIFSRFFSNKTEISPSKFRNQH
jgi:AraC-like DNA-binding protein